MTTAGYSGTPLAKKLGIKPGHLLCTLNAPDDYADLVAPLPDHVKRSTRFAPDADIVHLFVTLRHDLERELIAMRPALRPDAAIWVSWPKKASKVATDISEDSIRAVALPMGLVDIKVCAVDAIWSGLKLVIRKELRGK